MRSHLQKQLNNQEVTSVICGYSCLFMLQKCNLMENIYPYWVTLTIKLKKKNTIKCTFNTLFVSRIQWIAHWLIYMLVSHNCAARHILPIQVKFRWCLKYIFLRHCYVWCFVHSCINEYAHMSWEASQVFGVIIFPRNVSFREYYVFVSNAAAFEGFKLRSSNLTHAFQNGRSIWNGQKCDRKWISDIQNGRRQPFCQKCPKKIKVAYRSEMARNAIESEFRTSKMADRSEMARNAIESEIRTSKMAVVIHFVKKMKVMYPCEMDGNEIESEFRTSKMADSSHFVKNKKNKSCVLIWNGQKCDWKWFSDIQNGHRQPFCKKKLQIKKEIKVA